MKNIYIIPTDKRTRLHYDHTGLFLSHHYQVSKEINSIVEGRNIYITSKGEITKGSIVKIPCGVGMVKELHWKYGNDDPSYIVEDLFVSELRYGQKEGELQINSFRYDDCKLIVLTTDPLLIKDGIQEIDDEFLEWFVKNPSCERVEVGKTNKLIDNYAEKEEDKWEVRYYIYNIHETPRKNFYCGDEVDYGEQCSFQCDNCVDATGVDYGYLPKENLGYTTKMGIKVVDGMVRPLMVPKKYFGEVEHIHYSEVFDWLSKKDYLSDKREVIEKEYKEYLNK